MQYEVKESGYGVTITSAKFDVVITPEAPLNVAIGESAKMEVPQAINYIKSGEAEIKAAADIGVSRIGSTVTDGINRFNANATAKTTTYNDNATSKLNAYNLNAQNLTTAFNNNASDKTTAFNDNAAIKQAAVDASANAAAASAASAKQWAIGDPSEPTGYSAKYWANQAASTVSGLEARVTTIEGDIPAQASSSNQLADKNFVNSSIATNTANFIGTFNSVAELEAYSGQKDDNDYAFVVATDSAGNTLYNRYKWNGTAWLFEYALNNSSFTANQWAAINSGATTANIGQIAAKADDNAVVHKTGDETITGTKTFTSGLTIPSNTLIAKQDNNLEGGEIKFQRGDNDPLAQNPSIDLYNGDIRFLYCNSVKVITPATSSNDNTAATTAYVKNVLSALYPVGSIYIGTQSTCPLATLINGSTWELISAGRVLQGADSGHAAGTTIEAGLPNITGAFEFGNISGVSYPVGATRGDGAFMGAKYGAVANYGSGSYSSSNQALEFYASRSNAIYGNSTTVQPPAYVVNVWRRTA
jgi:hypothetical protein